MPIAGSLIALIGTDDNDNVVKMTTTSDSTGAYHFTNLAPGTYSTVLLTAPAGLPVPASDNQGTPGNWHRRGSNRFLNITLNGGVNGMNNDFGFQGQAVDATNLELIGIHQQQSQIVLQFNGPLNAAVRREPGELFADRTRQGRDLRHPPTTCIGHQIIAATYNPANATVTLIPNQHLNIHYHYVLQFNLPGVNACAPNVAFTSVFGRTAVPFFDVHGTIEPNPPLTAAEAQHNAKVVARTLAKLGKPARPGVGGWSTLKTGEGRHATARPLPRSDRTSWRFPMPEALLDGSTSGGPLSCACETSNLASQQLGSLYPPPRIMRGPGQDGGGTEPDRRLHTAVGSAGGAFFSMAGLRWATGVGLILRAGRTGGRGRTAGALDLGLCRSRRGSA